MKVKHVFTCIALFFLPLFVSHAQNTETDSLQVLSEKLSQLEERFASNEREQQYKEVWKRKKYWKFGMENPHMKRTDGESMTWKTDMAFFVQQGKTAYLHSKPIAGMLKFGIDYGFMDLSYAKLKLKTIEVDNKDTRAGAYLASNSGGFDDIVSDDPDGSIMSMMGFNLGMHKIEYGLHVGPSISVNPWNHLIVSAYFHVRPTMSGILENENLSYGFGCAMSAGFSVSYKIISLGVEGAWNSVKYKQASFEEALDNDGNDEDGDEEGNIGNLFSTKKFRLKQNGPRFYVSLRF